MSSNSTSDPYEELAYVLVSLAVPLAIRYIWDFYQRAKQPRVKDLTRPPRPKTTADRLSSFLLILLALSHIYALIVPPTDFLKEIGATVASPSFMVRNKFRDYMSEKFQGWIGPTPSEQESPSKALFDPITFEEQILPLERLYDKLRATKWRRWYGRFGHDAIVNCRWCQDELDYSIYDAAHFGLTYALSLIALGTCTLTWRKSSWRIYGFLYILIPLSVDATCYGLSTIDTMGLLDKKIQASLFEMTYRIRHFSLALLFFLAAVWNQKDVYTDADVLRDILKSSGSAYSRFMAVRLARATIFGYGPLRNKFMDFYKQKEAEKDAAERDIEFQELRKQVLSKNSLATLIQESNNFSNDVFQMAVADGLLSQFDNLAPGTYDEYANILSQESKAEE